MKKFSIVCAAIAAFFALSCNKEIPAGMKKVTITATVEGATKTSYTDNGEGVGVFSWTKGDQIAIKGSDNQFYTFTATSAGSPAAFTGYIPESVTLQKHALYPAGSASIVDGSYCYTIPEYKDLSESASADIPMSSYVSAGTYNFVHMTGAALLTFTNIPDGVDVVEISIVSNSVRLSGTQQIWSGTPFTFSAATAADDSEKTFVRKVAVTENTAQVYLPYKGEFWDSCVINVTATDETGNTMRLLTDKKMKGSSANVYTAGLVIPYTPLELPDYVPEANLSKVDWADENVNAYDLPEKASSSRQALRQLKVTADSYYMYVRLVASAEKLTSTASEYFGLFLYDAIDGSGDGYYGWNNSAAGNNEYEGEHVGTLDLTDYSVTLSVNGTAVDVVTEVSGDEVVWTLAIPRSVHPNLVSAGNVYVTFLTYAGWTPTGSVPEKYDPMMEVTLP